MRRKPSQGGYNNNNGGGGGGGQQRKQNYRQGGGGGGGHHHQNRPRKNYAAAREKYLQQARDALSQGDRVLAEYYFQHAEHCYRMLVEEGYNFRNNQQPQGQQGGQGGEPAAEPMEELPTNVSQLPAFLTGAAPAAAPKEDEAPPAAAGWEE